MGPSPACGRGASVDTAVPMRAVRAPDPYPPFGRPLPQTGEVGWAVQALRRRFGSEFTNFATAAAVSRGRSIMQ